MKKVVLSGLLLSASAFVIPKVSHADKIGYVSSEYIIELLPEYENAAVQFETFSKKLEEDRANEFKSIQDEAASLPKDPNVMTEVQKEKVQKLIQKYQKVEEDFNQRKTAKQKALIQPILNKIESAVKALGESENYDLIIEAAAVKYAKAERNVSDKVLKKLGVDAALAKKKRDDAALKASSNKTAPKQASAVKK